VIWFIVLQKACTKQNKTNRTVRTFCVHWLLELTFDNELIMQDAL
jgi:hypothetical protein